MKVACEISEESMENDDGREVDGIRATCSRCGHGTESFGTGAASVKRCLALMREECPERESNFYAAAADEGRD